MTLNGRNEISWEFILKVGLGLTEFERNKFLTQVTVPMYILFLGVQLIESAIIRKDLNERKYTRK